MPGLFGYIDYDASPQSQDNRILNKMRDLLIYGNGRSVVSEGFFHDRGVHAGYCAPNYETVEQCATENDGVVCWFDGEIYNANELTDAHSPTLASGRVVKNMLISAYRSDTLNDLLGKIDGYFSAVIYDKEKRLLKLMIDRFGFRHIFYTSYNKKFLWASEYKAFIAAPDFKIDVNKQSVDEFMKFGILCDNRTWLNGVYLLNPAAVLTYDMETGSVQTEAYRQPNENRRTVGKIDFNEYYEEWGRLFKASVAKRTGNIERMGLTLSGGLDSRAILAAMPLVGSKINAVTLGDKECDDVKFAAMAAKLKGANHQYFPLETDGWLERAYLGIWATDGALSLSSQLGIEHLEAFSKLFDVTMTGMGGGVMQGGMEPGASVYNAYGRSEDVISGLHMRNRRMIRQGFRLDESFYKVRIPYYDNDLYSFVMAIPQDIRKKGILINRALLHNFPKYYKDIPWQKTGVPISLSPLPFSVGYVCNILLSRFKRKLCKFGLPIRDSRLYFNVVETFDSDKNSKLAKRILSDKNAVYPQYVPEDFSIFSINKRLNVRVEKICRVLTFEIWMRQLSDPAFRPS